MSTSRCDAVSQLSVVAASARLNERSVFVPFAALLRIGDGAAYGVHAALQ
jgi:hypothetical protein